MVITALMFATYALEFHGLLCGADSAIQRSAWLTLTQRHSQAMYPCDRSVEAEVNISQAMRFEGKLNLRKSPHLVPRSVNKRVLFRL